MCSGQNVQRGPERGLGLRIELASELRVNHHSQTLLSQPVCPKSVLWSLLRTPGRETRSLSSTHFTGGEAQAVTSTGKRADQGLHSGSLAPKPVCVLATMFGHFRSVGNLATTEFKPLNPSP